MKKMLIALCMVFSIALVGNAMACEGPECSAEGNFDISTFAAGGGIDLDGKLIPNGATGGISAAGGVAGGQASGHVEEGRVPIYKWTWCGPRIVGWKTIKFGEASASLNTTGGGFTQTNSYKFKPEGDFDKAIGVGTHSDGYATTKGRLDVAAHGIAESHGSMFGLAGQGTLDGSIIGPSPKFGWDSNGVSLGVAGQGSVGGFVGGAGAMGYGSATVEAGVDMFGGGYSESYRGIKWDDGFKTETMGTNVGVTTDITSYGNVDRSFVGVGFVDGGYVAGGFAATTTIQKTQGGVAAAKAVGSYSGAGELNCNFNGSATGYSQTSATTAEGYKGSVMNSQAGMNVTINMPK